MNLTDNLDKLPKWAQQEIKVLKIRLGEAKEELIRINDNVPSNTVIGHEYSFKDSPPPKYLQDNQRITFKLKNGNIEAWIEKDVVKIHASGLSGELNIRPQVSNGFYIQLI